MTTLAGVRIHPGFFKQRTFKEGPRASAGTSFKVKRTVVHKPTNPRAKHAMPALAIFAAIASIGPAVAAVGAIAGGAAITAGAIFSVITAVGAVTAAIGAVTGNEKLVKYGGILALVGGIGSFANNAGFFGSGSEGASGAASTTAGSPPMGDMGGATASGPSTGIAADGTLMMDGAGVAAAPDSGLISANMPTAPMPEYAAPSPAVQAPIGQAPVVDPQALATSTVDAGAASGTTANPMITTPTTPAAPKPGMMGAFGEADNMPSPFSSSGPSQAASGATQGVNLDPAKGINLNPSKGLFDGAFDKVSAFMKPVNQWTKDNPMLSSAILGGLSSAADPSNRALREAQTKQLQANTAMTDQMRLNQSGVGGLIDWSKIFKTATPPVKTGK